MQKDNRIWTIAELINWGSGYFSEKGISSPRLNIELILSNILNCNRLDLYLNYDKPLNEAELTKLRLQASRRGKHEPLQHITGKAAFLEFEMSVNKSVLIPRAETEELVHLAIGLLKTKSIINSIIDIGTGSGCIAIAMAKAFPQASVIACDLSNESLSLAKQNAQNYNIHNIEFVNLDIMNNIPALKFDLIISNPPYIPKSEISELAIDVKNYEPLNALTDDADGLSFFRRFSEIFPEMLLPEGIFCLECGFNQATIIKEIFLEAGISTEFKKDFQGIDRFIFGLT